MNLSAWSKNIQEIKLQRNYSLVLNVFLSFALFLSLSAIVLTSSRHNTILVPAGMTNNVTVGSSGVSESYLLQWSEFITSLRLNVTPETVSKNQGMLLPYVSNKIYGKFKAEMIKEQGEIVSGEISTVFYPKETKIIDSKRNKVESTGLLKVYIGETLHESVTVSYNLEFDFVNNKLLLKNFSEVSRV